MALLRTRSRRSSTKRRRRKERGQNLNKKKQQKPKAQTQHPDTIVRPISVFVSSPQDEYAETRKDIKAEIDSLTIGDRPIFQTTLIELEHGEIEQDIEEGLKICEILILLLSNDYSTWVEKEFSTAWKSGIPIRVYKVETGHGVRRVKFERQQKFLKSILKKGIRIFGYDRPYSPHSARLLQDIDADLAILAQQMTHDYVKIRRIIKR